jgi:multidrug efflux system outer membrane protein
LSPTGTGVTENIFAGYVSASWDIDLWGRIGKLDQSGRETLLASEEARQAITLSLIANVANIWLSGRELDERIILADQTIASRRDSARIARRRFEVGSAAQIDQTLAEALLGDAESAAIALKQNRAQTLTALTVLVGTPLDDEITPLSSVEDAVIRDLPPGLPSALLAQRPDIRGAENRLRAAELNVGAARAAFFPRIALIGDGGVASTALDTLFNGSGTLWALASSLTAPILDGGRLQGGLAEAKANRQIAIGDYEKTVQTAFRDVADALAARHWLNLQIATQYRSLNALRNRARLAELRYRAGSSTYLEVQEAQRDLFALEQALVETRRAKLSSEINLFAALGGGRDDPSRASATSLVQTGEQLP